jgi:anti-repressor protein
LNYKGQPLADNMGSFKLDLNNHVIEFNDKSLPILVVGEDKDCWFRANDAAIFLGYSNFRKAITTHVKDHRIRPLLELLPKGGPTSGSLPKLNQNQMDSRYINEAGLYQLTMRSKLPLAEAFQD